MDQAWALIFRIREELLLFSAFWFVVGGLDDLAVDAIYCVRKFYRKATRYRIVPALRAEQIPAPSIEGPLAVFIPAWREAAVIGAMLKACERLWRASPVDHLIYVGCYPNDPASISAVLSAAQGSQHIRLVLCENPGPTTKADCLNRLWHALTRDELAGGYKAKAVILHDAEDLVHPLELSILSTLIERAAAVQLPVIPAQVSSSTWISGHYCDEFAEAHGKNLIVREALGASVPLAGVGCAIARNYLGRIAIERGGAPFNADSLTEDYELGLAIGAQRGKVIFARLKDVENHIVGTRACFPDNLAAATRQKARWMTGIALAGWDRMGWRGGFAENWMRLRDRKGVFAALVLLSAYACIILSVVLILAERGGLYAVPAMSVQASRLLWITLCLLLWRLSIRAVFVGQLYGLRQAVLSIPRTIIANIIEIIAARRACQDYWRHLRGRRLVWDKTTHQHFPDASERHG